MLPRLIRLVVSLAMLPGRQGAPLLGDIEAWDSRMEKGMDAVMANVINGVNAMPAKGLCMNCTDNELQEIVGYMISQ